MRNFNELKQSNSIISDKTRLKKRMDEEGYLFFKEVLNKESILNLRKDICDILQLNGWLKKDTEPMAGIANIDKRCTEGELTYIKVYHQIYKLRSFHNSGHWAELIKILSNLFEHGVFPIPQKILRIWFPKFVQHTTPFHQDFVHFQSDKQYTSWIPLGDCDIALGGLGVIPYTHREKTNHTFSLGAGNLKVDIDKYKDSICSTDYQTGDLLLFHVNTIHGALPNKTTDKLRLSLDNRFQQKGYDVAEHLLEPHLFDQAPFKWDDVYSDWDEDDDLKYYWKKDSFKVLNRERKYIEQAFNDAINLANSEKNEDALLFLSRVKELDPESEDGQKAIKTLDHLNI
tara:strand:+ start:975 stop:2003 length:1029 start_codon:yes stop_codon:yes gene_type:complete